MLSVQLSVLPLRLSSFAICFLFYRNRTRPRSTLFPYTPLSRSSNPAAKPATNVHDAWITERFGSDWGENPIQIVPRSEEHTSELQSLTNLVCRLLLEKKKICTEHRSGAGLAARRRTRPST